ncbi:general substrate transporter [Neurospora crassa]|uniref:MFS glucose transporter n=2 Tax=Neurospora crassa TaxID=5141 RepID=Q1K5W7_NEUCR|nr:MFS glucose transporter [Neurospora crassa OR74A]EAA28158.1 MFS glucose transporter [Neurospora crassa OR74A]KHE85806.1 general substrate transporter [Neurospora crassa]CAD71131.1 related to glucose transporter-3 [Neurospora crassa]|eukprot:XP_957394.1 MFS glucose transporter [Neurospora crassa OR74A]
MAANLRDLTMYLVVLIIVSTLGPLQFGFHLAELNAPEDVITCRKTSISSTISSLLSYVKNSSSDVDCIPMTRPQFATVSAIFTIGGLFGALMAGPFTSSRGRWLSMQLTAAFYIVGSLIETLSHSVPVLSTGRFLTGVGAGASTVIVPLYISEIAPPAQRGLFGAFTQISINLGILISQTMGYFLSHDSAWRWILGSGVVVAAAQGFGLLLAPESPKWTASARGDVAQARRTLQRIRGKNANIDEEVESWGQGSGRPTSEEESLLHSVEDRMEGLSRRDTSSRSNSPSPSTSSRPHPHKASKPHLGFVQVLKDPNTRPAIIAVVGIMFAQQLCGINSIIMYSVSLFRDLLPPSFSSGLLTICISIINLGTTTACSPLPDKFGRKACLLASTIGQGVSSLVLALSIMFGVKILSAIAALFFVAFFAVGLGPVPFILASELVGEEAVGATQSWALGASYIATFLVAFGFPVVNEALNRILGGAGWVYFIFAGLAAFWALFIVRIVPETKGKANADEVWGRTRRVD